MAAHERF
jgi:hypothetical protein